MSFWAYMLHCSDGTYYLGHTDELERRIAEHQSGAIPGYTHRRRPVTLAWSQDFPSRDEALAAERKIKGWSRAKKQALIAGDWETLHHLAVPPSERALRLRSGRTGEGNDSPHPFVLSQVEVPASPPTPLTPPPIIILVRPQLGENIGKAARAMLNFGLTELRLVAPRDGWPNPDAGPAASGADSVLANAQLFPDVASAVADCHHVYATTVRRRGISKPVVTPAEAATEIHAAPGRSAILFGPERSGLESDDVAVARTILTVPINPQFGSLNLAQAVILVAYEWSKAERLAQPPLVDRDPPAPQFELDGMMAQMEDALETAGFFFPPDRTPVTKRALRTMLTRPGWTAQEVRTFRGVLTALAKPQKR